jgi:hypothetical protein
MAEALANMPDRQQSYAAMVARMSYLSPPPELWTDLIAGVIEFADPLLGNVDGAFSYWDAEQVQWIDGPGASYRDRPARKSRGPGRVPPASAA